MTRRARWSSRVTRHALRAGGQALSVQPDRHDQRQRVDGRAAVERELGAGRTAPAGGRWPIVDTYYKVPGAGGINSNIKDMALWMVAQMGEMPDVLDAKVLDTIHAPYVVTPTERGRLRKFLERLGDRLVRLWLAQLRLCRAPHRRPPRRDQRLSLADPVRPAEEERRGRAVEQQHLASRAGSSSR